MADAIEVTDLTDYTLREKISFYFEKFPIELGLIMLFTLAGINYLIGASINQKKARLTFD